MNTNTATTHTSHDGQTARIERWTWQLDADTTAILTHATSTVGGGRKGRSIDWTASVLRWTPEAAEPEVELYSPKVSTKARAMEWLNTTGLGAL